MNARERAPRPRTTVRNKNMPLEPSINAPGNALMITLGFPVEVVFPPIKLCATCITDSESRIDIRSRTTTDEYGK